MQKQELDDLIGKIDAAVQGWEASGLAPRRTLPPPRIKPVTELPSLTANIDGLLGKVALSYAEATKSIARQD